MFCQRLSLRFAVPALLSKLLYFRVKILERQMILKDK